MKLKTLTLLVICNILERYEFLAYAALAPILAQVFFPVVDSPRTAQFLTFFIFFMGFIVRPIGGFFIGHLADEKGRRFAFLFTFFVSGLSVLLIGLLPGYEQIDMLAPTLLLILRVLHGFAVGGAYSVTIAYIGELSRPKWRGFFCSFANVSTVLGGLLAIITVFYLQHAIHHHAMIIWGWRIPFIISSILAGLCYLCRNFLIETLTDKNISSSTLLQTVQLTLFKLKNKNIWWIFGITIGAAVCFYTYEVFSPTYLMRLGYDYEHALIATIASSIVLILMQPVAGFLSDRWGRKSVAFGAIILLIGLIYPTYIVQSQNNFSYMLICQMLASFAYSFYLGSIPVLLFEYSGSQNRCFVIAAGYNLCIALFGGTAPLINIYLVNVFGINAPAFYIMLSSIISAYVLLRMPRISH